MKKQLLPFFLGVLLTLSIAAMTESEKEAYQQGFKDAVEQKQVVADEAMYATGYRSGMIEMINMLQREQVRIHDPNYDPAPDSGEGPPSAFFHIRHADEQTWKEAKVKWFEPDTQLYFLVPNPFRETQKHWKWIYKEQ